jgi:hypothetical protein
MTDQNVTNPEAVEPPETVTQPEPTEERKFTQAELDKIVKDRLAREDTKRKEAEKAVREKAEAEALKQNQEWEKLAAQRESELKQAQAELNGLKLNELKRAIASEIDLPPALASRLVGTTADEIREDAEALKLSLPKKTAPILSPTNPGGATQGESDEERRKRLLG